LFLPDLSEPGTNQIANRLIQFEALLQLRRALMIELMTQAHERHRLRSVKSNERSRLTVRSFNANEAHFQNFPILNHNLRETDDPNRGTEFALRVAANTTPTLFVKQEMIKDEVNHRPPASQKTHNVRSDCFPVIRHTADWQCYRQSETCVS
jgi:hypothetical protein